MKQTLLAIFGWLMLSFAAQAASFDCTKSTNKVEKLICSNSELAKLDEDMAKVYEEVRKKTPDEALLKRQQREWLKWRNRCQDLACLDERYRQRIVALNQANVFKDEESYTLVMSKDDELCNHMLQLFNQDLKKYGWKGDEYQEEHEEFKRVPWKPARFSSVIDGRVRYSEYRSVEGALFDFNNDGVQDFVVRWKASLSNARADLLYLFDSEIAEHANDLTSVELLNAKNKLYIAGWFYDLMPPFEIATGLRVLEPFIYGDTSYLVMRPLFEEQRTMTGYAVIAKYGGGTFINRNMTGKMEDICYYQRNRAKRAH